MDKQIQVIVDGRLLNFTTDPVILNGRLMIQPAPLCEALGANYLLDSSTETFIVRYDAIYLIIPVNEANGYKNGAAVPFYPPAQRINGTYMVPLRALAETLNLSLHWDSVKYVATVNSRMNVVVYYPVMTETNAYLKKEVHSIPYTKGVARAALEELIHGQPLTPGAVKVIPEATRILSITVEQGLAVVNFSQEVLAANAGAYMEYLGIYSIVNTLTEFTTIKQVAFKVENKLDDEILSWWGHVGIYNQPFNRLLIMVMD
ncbi:GerMN domain-containing protein [Desulforamulus hydrothermalis]|uniref:GerMN domain-containing protein n=1 Tax=Desulforamulus hydrothermalis Lam5 = DSM 18033 TaxID=1121428 RepID=K8DZK5_9FIRM|nr:GerMN domain-containing protein [Desulforamulus hydrothermalis]CCO08547.1 hypothetical protein DESHY_40097 [Desulforamulus hydrothermalis Lam5 = DSM 18033]SHH02469.1 Copper amine oxidase N-terminal domain-containing protein [Desulforamulus hydrothermalis Lam5 = DSM 18033]